MATEISFPYLSVWCPSAKLPISLQLRQQFWGHQKSQPLATTAENVCVVTCHSPVEGARVQAPHVLSCHPWTSNLTWDLQWEVKLVALSQPLCDPSTKLPVSSGGRNTKTAHREDASAQDSLQNSLEILVRIPPASCMAVADVTNSLL